MNHPPLAFSVNEELLSETARTRLRQAENWSYIFEISGGRPNANSQRVDAKYQLNPMLSPKWALPIGVRGDVRLSKSIANVIFSDNTDDAYTRIKDEYIDGLNAPYFNRNRKKRVEKHNPTIPLGFDEDDV